MADTLTSASLPPSAASAASAKKDTHKRRPFDEKKFEAKKKKIAQRLRAEEELEQFRQETGGTIGGEWINQKWVAKQVGNASKKAAGFDFVLWFKDTALYFAFLTAFTLSIFAGRGTQQIVSYENVWRRIVTTHIGIATNHEGVLQFLDDVIVGELAQQDNTDFPLDNYTFTAQYGTAYGSALVGAIRLRQVRVKSTDCSIVHGKLVESGLVRGYECFPSWINGEEENVYSKENETVFFWNSTIYDYQTQDDTQQVAIQGKFGFYPGSGYVADMTLQEAPDMISFMRDSHWIDFKTRAVVLEYMFYSANMDIFGDTRVLFEFTPSGAVHPSVLVATISLNRYPNDGVWSLVRIAMIVFVYLTVVFYILDDMDHCRMVGMAKYRQLGWAHMDLTNNMLFVLSGLFRVANFIMVGFAFPETATDSDVRQKIRSIGDALYMEDQINGLNGFLLWMKLFKYVGVTARIIRLANTITYSLRDVVTYMALFAIISYAFAILGYLLFGSELETYQTMTDSMVTIFRAMYGDVNFLEVLDKSGTVGFIYLFCWLVVSVTVLLNMIIAILADVYSRVVQDEKDNPPNALAGRIQSELSKRWREVFGGGGKVEFAQQQREGGEGDEDKDGEGKKKEEEPEVPLWVLLLRAQVEKFRVWRKERAERKMRKKLGIPEEVTKLEKDEDEEEEYEESDEEDHQQEIEEENRQRQERKTGASNWKPWPSRQVAPIVDVPAGSLNNTSMTSTNLAAHVKVSSSLREPKADTSKDVALSDVDDGGNTSSMAFGGAGRPMKREESKASMLV